MDKVKEKKKFSLQGTMGEKEYIEAIGFLPGIFWSHLLGMGLFVFAISITLSFVARRSITEAFLIAIALCTISTISCILQKKRIMYKSYQNTYESIDFIFWSTIDFYDTYLLAKSEYLYVKILYTKLTKIKEVDKYFYLFSPLLTVIIAKNSCTEEISSFIRTLPVKKYICKCKKGRHNLKERKGLAEEKRKIPNEKDLSILFWFLFFASIGSVYGAFLTQSFLSEGVPDTIACSTLWVSWLWLVFPLLSSVLGIQYSRYRFSSKNVVIGSICSILLFVNGCLFFVAPKPSYHFSEIEPYQNILQVKIPKQATYYQDKTVDFLPFGYVDISLLYVTYNDNNGEKLANHIKNSDFWLDSYEAEELYDILPTSLQSEYEDDYYLVFNKSFSQYNTLPEQNGKQQFIVAKYDSFYYRLYIYQYTLDYNDAG